MSAEAATKSPSLEAVVESGDLGIEILHPGGLEVTRELAELCHIGESSKVLDVASGTGETACYLAETFGCELTGVDVSSSMVERARRKATEANVRASFEVGDAHGLSFPDDRFDAVISECTLCLLDKEKAIGEMIRVAKPGGYVGMHDLSWKGDAPQALKDRLAEIESERPETLEGWVKLFEQSGLVDVLAVDKSDLVPSWMRESRRQLGLLGQLKVFVRVLREFGISGYRTIRESERIFGSEYMGYGIIVGRRPA